jgi:hypothetical protein
MFRSHALAFALLFVPLSALPAAAAPHCQNVHSHLLLEASANPGCTSPIGLCASATLRGSLRADTDFIGTSFVSTVDTPTTGVVVLTGDNTFHTEQGDFFTKGSIVLSTVGAGDFAEVDVVTGGTGDYAGATGTFTATGTFVNGIGEGVIDGTICQP